MPYLAINLAQKLSQAQKETVIAEFGRLITVIPGKTEDTLMVDLSDDRALYMGGQAGPCAYVDLRMYTKTTQEAKQRFTKDASAFLVRELGIREERVYLTIAEYDQWGYDGALH
jgi:phenylpyruvate tautomerase PptA (4-oxalocrotonate tautomerase family)